MQICKICNRLVRTGGTVKYLHDNKRGSYTTGFESWFILTKEWSEDTDRTVNNTSPICWAVLQFTEQTLRKENAKLHEKSVETKKFGKEDLSEKSGKMFAGIEEKREGETKTSVIMTKFRDGINWEKTPFWDSFHHWPGFIASSRVQ